jgi:hypothetical protein
LHAGLKTWRSFGMMLLTTGLVLGSKNSQLC